jgi:hypothetical protein
MNPGCTALAGANTPPHLLAALALPYRTGPHILRRALRLLSALADPHLLAALALLSALAGPNVLHVFPDC